MNDRASRRAPQAGDTELSGPPAAEAIAPQVLRETASWLLLMQEGPLAPAQQAELESWRSRSPEHQRAWRRAERLLANIGSLPPALARRALERPSGSGRRAVLRSPCCSAAHRWSGGDGAPRSGATASAPTTSLPSASGATWCWRTAARSR